MRESGTAQRRRNWGILLAVGALGGLLSGLFAIGGGIIMVPLLTMFARMDQRRAAATSLAAIVPTAIVGSVSYSLVGQIDLAAGLFISVGAIPGAVLGSALLKRVPLRLLRWMFIVFVLLVAARMFFLTPERSQSLQLTLWLAAGYVALGVVMGVLSGLFGIGGGIIAVPALVGVFAASDLVAKGTSLAVMIPTSIVGTVANWRSKNVDVPAGLAVGIAATVASIPGAALALVLPPRVSAALFGVLLIGVAVQLTFTAVGATRRAHEQRTTPSADPSR